MMSVEDFKSTFFGEANDIDYEAIEGGQHQELGVWLSGWVERLEDRRITFLPRTHSGQLYWYGLAFDEPGRHTLTNRVRAWLGPSFTDYHGQPFDTPSDRLEEHVNSLTDSNWLRLQVADEDKHDVRTSLGMMRDIVDRKPQRVTEEALPAGRLLRDFEWSLRRKDEEVSAELLDALEASGHLDAMNLSYLKVQRLHELAFPEDLLGLPDLPHVVASRRPRLVTQAITESLYATRLHHLIQGQDFDAALRIFTDGIAGRFNALFGSLPARPSTPELHMQLLWALVSPPKPALLQEILAADPSPTDSDSFRAWATAQIPQLEEPLGTLTVAEEAIREGAFHTALRHLRETTNGLRHAQLAVHCAYELGSQEAAAFALATLDDLEAEQKRELRESRTVRHWIDDVSKSLRTATSWAEVVVGITSGEITPEHIEEIQEAALDWDPMHIATDQEQIVNALLSDRSRASEATLRALLPALVRSIERIPLPSSDPRIRPVLSAIAVSLLLADTRSEGDLETLLDIVGVLLDGASEGEYAQLIDDVCQTWEDEQSRRRFGWLLDICELVAGHPVRDRGALDKLLERLNAGLSRWYDQLPRGEMRVALRVLDEFDTAPDAAMPEVETTADAATIEVSIENVGIYTLSPGVGARAKGLIETLYPSIDVRLNSDKVSTDRLTAMAQEVDVLLVVTRSATHAATDALKSARPEGKDLLYVRGKGSTSILQALETYIERQQPKR